MHELTSADRVLRDVVRHAADIEEGSLLETQCLASAWLGDAWMTRRPGAHDTEAALVRDVIAKARRGRHPQAWLALRVLATLPREEWLDDLDGALAEAPVGAPSPVWVRDPRTVSPERPVRARLWTDPWNNERVHLLDYDEPEMHALLVHLTTDGGLMVRQVIVGALDGEPEAMIDNLIARGDQDVDESLTAVADALHRTDMYWPPNTDPDYTLTRAIGHWRTRGHRAVPEWQPVGDDERRRLLDDFAAAHGPGLGLDADVVELLADTLVDFGEGYLHGGVLAWSPGEVERFMLDWVQRKVLLDDADARALPAVLHAWVGFALNRSGLAPEHVTPVQDAVHEWTDEYLELLDDPSAAGPAKALLTELIARGVDLDDKKAVDSAISAYNAEQLARRLLE